MGGVDWVALTGPGAEFVKKYQAKYGDPEAYAVYGYEAAKVVLESIKKVGKDRDKVRETVLGTKGFNQGALGTWGFDADGDITLQNLTISRVENGKFKPVLVVDKT
jgi:branched-chain amino acid transport system substrate-binding protein